MTNEVFMSVNGTRHQIPAAWMARRLIDFLREELKLVGAKEGCGEGDCGACTVLVDGQPMCSCLLLCGVVASKEVTTIEGLEKEHLKKFSDSSKTEGGVQCGFCTDGFAVMSAWMKDGGTETGNESVAKLLEGNLCRCGGYQQLNETLSKFK